MALRRLTGYRRVYVWLAAGAVAIGGLVILAGPSSWLLGVVFTVMALFGLRYMNIVVGEARRDEEAVHDEAVNGPIALAVQEGVRRELLRGVAQTLFLAVGASSVLIRLVPEVPAWFERDFFQHFLPAAFLYVQYVMWVNARADSSLNERIKAARRHSEDVVEEREAHEARNAARRKRYRDKKK